MAKVLVTGAKGLLGSSLVPYLTERGYEVIPHSREEERGGIGAELTNIDAVNNMLEVTRPDFIVNLAALTNVDECESNPQLAYMGNVRSVENLVKAIENTGGDCHLIHLSTDQVYDEEGPQKEENITLRNYYGFSKYASEIVAGQVSSTIIRTNFFGHSRCQSRNSFSDWLVQALRAGDPVTVFEDVRFSPLNLNTLVKMLGIVLMGPKSGVFNLGSKKGMSKAEFAFTLAKVFGLSTGKVSGGSSDKANLIAYRPKDMCMDSSKFENAHGVKLPLLEEEINSLKMVNSHDAKEFSQY